MADPGARHLVLLLLVLTGQQCFGAGDSAIPFDSEEECTSVVGATWRNRSCECSQYYLAAPNRTSCLPRLGNSGAPCEATEQCADVMVFGECVSGACLCPAGFHYLRGRCWPSARLGEKCSRSEECHVNHDPLAAVCSPQHNVCKCSDGYYTRGNIDCRLQATAPGESCGLDNDCRFHGGACNPDTHICYSSSSSNSSSSTATSSTTMSSAATEAASHAPSTAAAVLVGSACENNTWCAPLANSRCFGAPLRCLCLPGFFGADGSPACTREIGESCSSSQDCAGMDNSECRNNTCACAAGFIATSSNTACKPAKKYGNSCSPKFPEQCSDYGWWCDCLDKPSGDGQQCLCAAGHHFVEKENLCWVSRGLNETCREDQDCVVNVGSAHCFNATCQCAEGLHLSHDGAQCVNVTALGDKCSTSEDCSGLGANVECSSNKCRCASHYYEGAGSQACLPGLGAACSEDSGCSREHSACVDSSCACADGYISSNNAETCLEVAKQLGSNCTEKQQCTQSLGELSECQSSRCVCGNDYQYRMGRCLEKKAPGDKCASSAECFVQNNLSLVECRNSVCQCKIGYSVTHSQQCVSSDASPAAAATLWTLAAAAAASLWRPLSVL